VYEYLIRFDYFADYSLEQCTSDLAALVNWSNLIPTQDTRKVTSLEEFKNKIYGFRLYKKDGQEHLGARGFFEEGEPFYLTLRTLSDIKRIEASTKLVYIVENSGVFSELADRLTGKDAPLICTNGQLHVSSQIFLDMLVADGFTLYYSGDFDPEGVEIAWKLKKRYGESFHYWHYQIEDYRKAMSNKEITRDRLFRLEKIDDDELREIIGVMRTEKKAGYQEALLAEMMGDVNLQIKECRKA